MTGGTQGGLLGHGATPAICRFIEGLVACVKYPQLTLSHEDLPEIHSEWDTLPFGKDALHWEWELLLASESMF